MVCCDYVRRGCLPLGPHRPFEQVSTNDSVGHFGGFLTSLERREQLRVGEPLELLGREVGRIEQSLAGSLKHRPRDSGDVMAVHRRVHQCASDEQAFCSRDVTLGQHEVSVHKPERAEQSPVIDSAVWNPGVVSVSNQIVHSVHVKFARDELTEFAVSSHEFCDFVGVQVVAFEDVREFAS